ncbi:MAG: LLM class flavin-dependent oxidoreductase, partial [Acidimicrobiia bacterium]|nr:LLM class flavin-dependent oxidoreductase [Acidimicrobiia bacterium]
MHFDVMVGPGSWDHTIELARNIESVGFSGLLFTETSSVPWMRIAAAARAAPSLFLSTGIAVAFPR